MKGNVDGSCKGLSSSLANLIQIFMYVVFIVNAEHRCNFQRNCNAVRLGRLENKRFDPDEKRFDSTTQTDPSSGGYLFLSIISP